jgi:hypothetical protein
VTATGTAGLLGAQIQVGPDLTARVTAILVDADGEPVLLRVAVRPFGSIAYVPRHALTLPSEEGPPTCGVHVLLTHAEAAFYERHSLVWICLDDVSQDAAGGSLGF